LAELSKRRKFALVGDYGISARKMAEREVGTPHPSTAFYY
jgi:hypothetical protein